MPKKDGKPTRREIMERRDAEKIALEARNTNIMTDLLGGMSHKVIAERYSISTSTVRDVIRNSRETWKDMRVDDYDFLLLVELERINRIEDEAWASWEKSKEPLITTTKRTDGNRVKDEDGNDKLNILYEEVKRQTRHPDPRFLDRVAWCVEQRLRILGAYAPEKHAATTPDGKSPAPFTKVAFIKVIAPKERQEPNVIQALPSGD